MTWRTLEAPRLVLGCLTAIGAIVPTACSESGEAPQAPAVQPPAVASEAEDDGLARRLDAHVRTLELPEGGFCGSVLVARGDTPLLCRSYGLADAERRTPIADDALWDWASVSKQFTAAAILKLEIEGRLRLDDPLARWLPDVPDDKRELTLRHLLTHTAGVDLSVEPDAADLADRDAAVRFFLALPMRSRPGSAWWYSNPGYIVLAAVVELVSGERFEDYCTEHLFRPAGMLDTAFIGAGPGVTARVPRQDRGRGERFPYGEPLEWNYRGAGGVLAPVRDLLRWDQALRGDTLFDAHAKAELYDVALNGYALGWFVDRRHGDTCYEHGGEIGESVTWYQRTETSGIVVAIASSCPTTVDLSVIADQLVRIARDGESGARPDLEGLVSRLADDGAWWDAKQQLVGLCRDGYDRDISQLIGAFCRAQRDDDLTLRALEVTRDSFRQRRSERFHATLVREVGRMRAALARSDSDALDAALRRAAWYVDDEDPANAFIPEGDDEPDEAPLEPLVGQLLDARRWWTAARELARLCRPPQESRVRAALEACAREHPEGHVPERLLRIEREIGIGRRERGALAAGRESIATIRSGLDAWAALGPAAATSNPPREILAIAGALDRLETLP